MTEKGPRPPRPHAGTHAADGDDPIDLSGVGGTLPTPNLSTAGGAAGGMLPGVVLTTAGTTTRAWSANVVYYQPFIATQDMAVTALDVTVSTNGGGGSTARVGIYESTSDLQPGALVVDAGDADISANTRVVLTFSAVNLVAGNLYLFAWHPSAAVSTRAPNGSLMTGPVRGSTGQTVYTLSKSKTKAALATPGTAWDTSALDNTATFFYPVGVAAWT